MSRLTSASLALCVGIAAGPPVVEAFWGRRGLEPPSPVAWAYTQHQAAARVILGSLGNPGGSFEAPPEGALPRNGPGNSPSSVGNSATPESAAGPNEATAVQAGPEELRDQSYADASAAQRLDLYLPQRDGLHAIPLVLNVHGGAFSGGDKSEDGYNHAALLGAGFAVADVNYRLSGEAAFPAGAQDVKAAIIWLRQHAAEHGIDPNKFVVWGRSAGAYIVSAVGVTNGQQSIFDVAGQSGTKLDDVQAVVGLYGPANFSSMTDQARNDPVCAGGYQDHDEPNSPESTWLRAPVQKSPLTPKADLTRYVRSADPTHLPVFWLFHGSNDCTVSSAQSQVLADSLEKAGATVHLDIVTGAGHSDSAVDSRAVDVAVPTLTKLFANS